MDGQAKWRIDVQRGELKSAETRGASGNSNETRSIEGSIWAGDGLLVGVGGCRRLVGSKSRPMHELANVEIRIIVQTRELSDRCLVELHVGFLLLRFTAHRRTSKLAALCGQDGPFADMKRCRSYVWRGRILRLVLSSRNGTKTLFRAEA